MSADWKAGDRALVIRSGKNAPQWQYPYGRPVVGTVYLVEYACVSRIDGNNTVLALVGNPGAAWGPTGDVYEWDARAFRKIVPACDRQAVAQEREAGV